MGGKGKGKGGRKEEREGRMKNQGRKDRREGARNEGGESRGG